MAGLFVPLNVSYFDDDKIVSVGPYTELLYVRALAFCKRANTEGTFTGHQLSILGTRIPRLADRARTLVQHDLWQTTDTGWFITAWFHHNPSNNEIRTSRSTAGMIGNHRRWHLPPHGTPSPDCKFCIANASH